MPMDVPAAATPPAASTAAPPVTPEHMQFAQANTQSAMASYGTEPHSPQKKKPLLKIIIIAAIAAVLVAGVVIGIIALAGGFGGAGLKVDTGDPNVDALIESLIPPDSNTFNVQGGRLDEFGSYIAGNVGMETKQSFSELKDWYAAKLPELGFVDTMGDYMRETLQDPNASEYGYHGEINGYTVIISLMDSSLTADGDKPYVYIMVFDESRDQGAGDSEDPGGLGSLND
jgi:hypothetical protein